MKLSELTYTNNFWMHTDRSDEETLVNSESSFKRSITELTNRYGDVEVELVGNKLNILDQQWLSDHKEYCNTKSEWCNKYGCE